MPPKTVYQMSDDDMEKLAEFVRRLALMPSTDDTMLSTFSKPEWDDVSNWWRDFVTEARKLTGVTYKVTP